MYRTSFLVFYIGLAVVAILSVDVLLTFGKATSAVSSYSHDSFTRSLWTPRFLGSSDHETSSDTSGDAETGHDESNSSHSGGGGEHSLFGVVSSLNMLIGSVSVIIIIVAVRTVIICFERRLISVFRSNL